MNEIQTLIKRIKRKRKVIFTLFIASVLAVFVFLTETKITVSDKTVTFGLNLSNFAVAAAVIAVCFVFLWIYAFDAAKVENIMLNECDPEKYFIVKQNTTNKHTTNKSETANDCANAAFAIGDFAACVNYAMQNENDKKSSHRLSSALNICRASFFLGNTENMKIALGRVRAESEKIKTKYAAKGNQQTLKQLEMLCFLSEGNIAQALELAESVSPVSANNISQAFCGFYRGLVYREAGEKIKAIHCFMTAKEKGGKMFVVSKSEEMLKALEAEV